MKNRHLLLIAVVALFAACKHKSDNQRIAITMTPNAGFGVSEATPLKTMVQYPASFSPDSVVYYLDSVRLESKQDSSPIYIKVDTLHMGQHTIMGKVWKDGEMHLGMTTFFRIPPAMPERLTS